MKKSLFNPYTHNMLVDKMTLTEYYDNLLFLDWDYHLIDNNDLMYQKESEIVAWYDFAVKQSNPRYLQHFNMVRQEMRNKNINL